MKKLFIIMFLFSTFSSLVFAQPTSSIKGEIKYPEWKFSSNSKIVLKNVQNNCIIQENKVNENGTFTFRDVPFSNYLVEYYESDLLTSSKKVSLNSSLTQKIILNIKQQKTSEIVVLADISDKGNVGGKTTYTQKDIEEMPVFSNSKLIETVILNSAGTVPDEDGRMHIRGEDAQLQYVIDGIPVYGNQTRIYSSLFNASNIKSMDFIRGGANAEYGVATAGILNINTKSGFDRPIFAHAFGQSGSFASNDAGVEIGGNLDQKIALFVGASSSKTDRYLDPISLGDPIHNAGKSNNIFVKADALLSDKIDLVILGAYSTSNLDIPNSTISSKQDQKQAMTNSMIGLRLNAELGEKSVMSLVGYTRNDIAEISSNGINRIANSADSIKALQNEKYFMGGKRDNKVIGGMLEFTTKILENDNFKAGIGGEVYPLKEYLSFAVTNRSLSTADSSGGDERFVPYDITRSGSKPFLVDQSKDGNRLFAYVQDVIPFEKWNLSVGLRYDYFNLFKAENNLSLRLGANYLVNEDLILRASYNRIAMQSPLENILVSSSIEAATLTGKDQMGIDNKVKSEKSHILEIGGLYKLNDYVTIDLAGYGKLIEDFIVKVELGNSGVIFPVNLKNGLVAGGELQVKLNNWNNFSGFLSFSTCFSVGLKPDDGSSPISSGLILGEEGHNYSHPFAGEDFFPTEHNQLLTAAFNINYNFGSGIFATLGGRFDSGLPFDLVDSLGKGLDAAQSRLELKRRGYSDKVIDMLSLDSEMEGSPDKSVAPHAIFDLSAGVDFRKLANLPFKLTLSVLNIFDTAYLYKFESSFGGSHFGTPRMINLRADVFSF
ncbi:MAG: TonB-dependent receptor [Candidatus Kapabacteria bacterium]|nr:TonB-dependent receptor [Candidatus Kapabacteria bacterium]